MASQQPSNPPPMDPDVVSLLPTGSSPTPTRSFPFFLLPSELRLRIYELLLVHASTIDLDPLNHRRLRDLQSLLLTSHRVRAEASQVFYGSNTFRLFPLHPRFFHTKRPLLARLPHHHRAAIHTLELRLGPGWTAPPKCWDAGSPRLGLADCTAVRRLEVFVECDPASDEIFRGFRRGDDFYTRFCRDLVHQIMCRVPSLSVVQFDAWPSVRREAPLVRALLGLVEENGLIITWGPARGWRDGKGEVDRLEEALAELRL